MNRTRGTAFAFMLMLLATPLTNHAQSPAPSGQGVKSAAQRSLMAFRVMGRRGRLYEKWLVMEDTARGQFWYVNYTSSGYRPTSSDTVEDRDDMWSLLDAMRYVARFSATSSFSRPTADSIDGAVALQQTAWQDLQKRAAQATKSRPVPEKDYPTGTDDDPRPVVQPLRNGGPSDEEVQRMMAEVWSYAGGKRLEWKQGGRTPAGRKYEVLTFDGSEKVVASQTSVEIPNQSK